MIGIVVGTYSSIYIASSIVIAITHHNEKRIGEDEGDRPQVNEEEKAIRRAAGA